MTAVDPSDGGSSLWCNDSAALSIPAAPAAPFRCPMFDLTDPSGIEPTGRPRPEKASVIAATSTTSPTFVDAP